MTHKCVRCGTIYPDNDSSILRGCTGCGSIFFLYMKSASDAEQIAEIQKELQEKDTTLEEELTKKIQEEKQKVKEEKIKEVKAEKRISEMKPKVGRTTKFGIETIRVPKEGVYEINIEALMKKRPLIILEKEKIYLIHLPSLFEKVKGK